MPVERRRLRERRVPACSGSPGVEGGILQLPDGSVEVKLLSVLRRIRDEAPLDSAGLAWCSAVGRMPPGRRLFSRVCRPRPLVECIVVAAAGPALRTNPGFAP